MLLKLFVLFLLASWFLLFGPYIFSLCIYIPIPVNVFSIFWINHFFHYRSMKWSCFKNIVCFLQKLLSLLCWDCLTWCPCHCFFKVLQTFPEFSFLWDLLSALWGFWNMVSGSPLYLFCCFPFFLSYGLWTMLFYGHFHPSCIPLAWYKWFLSLVKLSSHFDYVSRF